MLRRTVSASLLGLSARAALLRPQPVQGRLVPTTQRAFTNGARASAASGGGGGGGGGPGRSREVVYLGFLPDVPLNRTYAAAQLARFRSGQPPQDQWQEQPQSLPLEQHCEDFQFSSLGRRLMGIDPWV